jgi:hypothetical protein
MDHETAQQCGSQAVVRMSSEVKDVRDRCEHFGNGRLVRNAFEDAIRHLANRIANLAPITEELLTRLEAADLHFDQIPIAVMDQLDQTRFRFTCSGCGRARIVPAEFLSKRVKCRCGHRFRADWGELVAAD